MILVNKSTKGKNTFFEIKFKKKSTQNYLVLKKVQHMFKIEREPGKKCYKTKIN